MKAYLTIPFLVLCITQTAPVVAQDLGGPRSDHDPRLGPRRNLDVRPRGQRDQMVPPGDAFSTEEPDDDDLDVEDPNAPPADRRL